MPQGGSAGAGAGARGCSSVRCDEDEDAPLVPGLPASGPRHGILVSVPRISPRTGTGSAAIAHGGGDGNGNGARFHPFGAVFPLLFFEFNYVLR